MVQAKGFSAFFCSEFVNSPYDSTQFKVKALTKYVEMGNSLNPNLITNGARPGPRGVTTCKGKTRTIPGAVIQTPGARQSKPWYGRHEAPARVQHDRAPHWRSVESATEQCSGPLRHGSRARAL